jgi:hypothetical protein
MRPLVVPSCAFDEGHSLAQAYAGPLSRKSLCHRYGFRENSSNVGPKFQQVKIRKERRNRAAG